MFTLISSDLIFEASRVVIKSMSSTGLPWEELNLSKILSSISYIDKFIIFKKIIISPRIIE